MMDEAPVWISINGERRVMLSCSPIRIDALAAGHLLAEGWARDIADVQALVETRGPGGAYGVEVTLPAERVSAAEEMRRHRLLHGCGLRHVLDCDTAAAAPLADVVLPDLTPAFRALFAAADAAAERGVHAAAFCADDGSIAHVAVDVARHCAFDRAIGLAALERTAARRSGLVLSSRISATMAAKAAHAGLMWIASRSVATPLAREIAAATGVRLIEQAVRRS